MRRIGIAFAALLAMILGLAAPAVAQLRVDVTQGNIQPMPIAIPNFAAPQPSDATAAQNIAGVVRADLQRSGLFKPLDAKSFIDRITNINVPPNYANWRVINAQGLVTGQVQLQPDGRLQVDFRLWDIYGEIQMLGEQYFASPENWRQIAHMISDAIYERVTGEKGYFNTRIVYIAERGPPLARKKLLAIMDEDGANPIYMTHGDYMVLTPRFNPTAQTIAYLSYVSGKPRVYLFDIDSGRQQMLGDFPDMTFSPRFSPDGNKVAMTLEKNGNSDIYVMDLRTRALARLTTDPAIDTAPSF
jgi:TolB protein